MWAPGQQRPFSAHVPAENSFISASPLENAGSYAVGVTQGIIHFGNIKWAIFGLINLLLVPEQIDLALGQVKFHIFLFLCN